MSGIQGISGRRFTAPQVQNKAQTSTKQASARKNTDVYVPGESSTAQAAGDGGIEVRSGMTIQMTHQNGVALSPNEGRSKLQEAQAKYEERQRALLYEENENGVKVPKNYVMLAEATEGKNYSQQIAESFAQYHSGEGDAAAVKDTLSGTVAALRSYYIEQGYSEADIMSGLIEDVYSCAKLNNIHGAFEASWQDSLPLAAEQNGHDGNTRDWIYYDAKYYYSSEEMKTTLQSIMREIGAEYGVTDLDLSAEYADGDIRKGIYSSYNTIVNDNARNSAHVGSMIDETMVPPEGLRFFYKGNEAGTNLLVPQITAPYDEPEAAFDGALQVWYGDWSFTGRVPVRQNPDKFPISVNMFDVINNADPGGAPSEITDFLKNFDFFAKFQSGRYAEEHPRNY